MTRWTLANKKTEKGWFIYKRKKALLMELVDVVVLGTIAERRESSSLSESKNSIFLRSFNYF